MSRIAARNGAETDVVNEPGITPFVIDLGKEKKRRIKALKRGRGRLVQEVEDVLAEVRSRLGAGAEDKELVPIVMIYRRKRRARGRGLFPFV